MFLPLQWKEIKKSYFNKIVMKFKEQIIIFNEVLSRMSPYWDTDFGRMRPNHCWFLNEYEWKESPLISIVWKYKFCHIIQIFRYTDTDYTYSTDTDLIFYIGISSFIWFIWKTLYFGIKLSHNISLAFQSDINDCDKISHGL